MGEAFVIQYSGTGVGQLYKMNNTLYLTQDTSTTTYDLTHVDNNTLTKIVAILNALTYITCTLKGTGTDASTLINDISINYPADIKTQAYVVGYGNYTSPYAISEIIAKSPEDIHQTWFDSTDAFIEKLTGYVFTSATYTGDIDIKNDNIRTNNNYEYYTDLFKNAYYLSDYAPVTAISALEIDGTTITASTVKLDKNNIILTTDSELTRWIPGLAKATVTITYGYASTSNEAALVREFATLIISGIYHGYDLMEMTTGKVNRVDHMGVTLTSEGYPIDLVAFEREKARYNQLLKQIPKKQIWRVTLGV